MNLTETPAARERHPSTRGDTVDRGPWWGGALNTAGASLVFTAIQIVEKVFMLKDPRRLAPPARRGAGGATREGSGPLPPLDYRDSRQPLRAMVITGDQAVAEALARLMYLEGLSPDWAGTGSLGLRLVELVDPDLVLLDAMVTGPDGSAVAPVLRARSAVPIILFNSCEIGVGSARSPAAGVDDQIAWPLSASEVQATVRRVLNQRGAQPAVLDLRDEHHVMAAARASHRGTSTEEGPTHVRGRASATRNMSRPDGANPPGTRRRSTCEVGSS